MLTRTRTLSHAAITLVALAVAPLAPARADLASDVRLELQAAGVPSPSVTVVTPAPATAADMAAYDQDIGIARPSLTPENLLSPDPTAPLPLLDVSFGKPSVVPLPGVLRSAAIANWYALDDAEFPLWRLEIMAALKRALVRGHTLAGVSMRPVFPNRSGSAEPDFYLTPPDPGEMPPGPFPQTMSTAEAKRAIQEQLPLWARAADVQVADWVGGERRATIAMTATPVELAATNPQDIAVYLLDEQHTLNEQGANIGSVVLRISNATAGPLFTFAGDGSWGQFFAWVNPIVRAFVPDLLDESIDATERHLNDEVARAQEEPLGLP